MRSLTAAAIAEKNTPQGIEPLCILQVEWLDGTFTNYADKDLTISNQGINAEGKILSLSNLDEVISQEGSSKSTSIQVSLDDSSGFIKDLLDQYDLHKRPCYIKQFFSGLADEDAFILFKGQVNSPIIWSLETKRVTFDIVSDVESNEAGFTPEEGQFASIPEDLIGLPWPMCFGSPVHVPATKFAQTLTTKILNNVFLSDYSQEMKRDILLEESNRLKDSYDYFLDVITLVNSTAKTPENIKSDYIDATINEDKYAQEIETFGDIVNNILSQQKEQERLWHKKGTNKTTKNKIQIKLSKIKKNKVFYLEELALATKNYDTAKSDKITQKMHMAHSKRIFKIVGQIRSKLYDLMDESFDIDRQLRDINAAILDELTLVTNTIYLSDATDFPQGDCTLDLKGIILKGQLSGNIFTILKVLSNHPRTIVVNNHLAGPDYFFLPDATKDYTGLFAYVDDNYVIEINKQEGNKCYFSPVDLPNLGVFKDTELDYSDVSKGEIQTGLADTLNGSESDGVLAIRANELPSDLSSQDWKKINGVNNRTQTIRMITSSDASELGGFWRLYYMGIESMDISPTASATEIMLALNNFVRSKTLTSVDKVERLILTFQNIQVTGGPIHRSPVTVTFPEPNSQLLPFSIYMHPLLPNSANLTTSNDSHRQPKIVVKSSDDTGANQFTLKKREKMEMEILNSSPQLGADFLELRRETELALKKLKEAPNAHASKHFAEVATKGLNKIIAKHMQMNSSENALDDANRAISAQEERDLLSMEVLNYMDWRRTLTPIFDPQMEQEREERYYIAGYDITEITEASPIILNDWVMQINNLDLFQRAKRIYSLPASGLQSFPMGTEIRLHADYQERYIANILPSTVHAVYAKRSVGGSEALMPVPQSYYVKNENADFGILNATTITLKKPLQDYKEENWKDEKLFITLTSSVGPNIADICEHLISTYTNLTPDATTFAEVVIDTDKFPCNFAVLDRKDCLTLVKDICWQARCAFWIDYGNAYIRYLPKEPTSVSTITESDIQSSVTSMTFTRTEDIKTKITGSWRTNYAQETLYRTIVRSNVDKYGEVESHHQIYIYNNKSLVEKTVSYWALQLSNCWKKVDMVLFMNNVHVQTMDCVTLNLPHAHYSNSAVKAVLEKADYDSSNFRINVSLRLPVISGEMDEFVWAWPQNITTIYPTDEMVFSSNTGSLNNYGASEGGLESQTRPIDLNSINIIPSDFGDSNHSDTDFVKPDTLADNLSELQYDPKAFTNAKKDIKKKNKSGSSSYLTFKNEKKKAFIDRPDEVEFLEDDDGIDNPNMFKPIERFEPFMGTIVGLDNDKTTTLVDHVDAPEITEATSKKQYYKVQRSDGAIESAFINTIHPEETAPEGASITCIYDRHHNDWNFQLPVFLNPNVDVPEIS